MSLPKWFPLVDWITDPIVVSALIVGTLVLAAATLLALPYYLARLPEDYFEAPRHPKLSGRIWWVVGPAKNILGLVLLLLGIAMLVLPGQGILTILVAFLLIDFPGKHRLERRIIAVPGVLSAINRLRARSGRPPLRSL
jgi:hypothetical protein